jgi:Na+/proline symporter
MIIPAILLPLYTFTPYFKWSLFGFLPVVPLAVLSIILLVIVSLVTPPEQEKNQQFFGVLDEMFGK